MDDKNIEKLINIYNEKLAQIRLPEMKVDELLDLIDYYSVTGMDFEAELFKRLAVRLFPNDPGVMLMCAHWEADDGDWDTIDVFCKDANCNVYDETLFKMEKLIRQMLPEQAFCLMEETVSALLETEDLDFIYDAAKLFRDFGYMRHALRCLEKMPLSYPEYHETLELAAECYFFLGDLDDAIHEMDRAIDANPFDDYLWAQTGLLEFKKGNREKALDACEYALAIEQNNVRALMLKEMLIWEKGEMKDFSPAYLIHNYSAVLDMGDRLYAKGDYAGAEALLQKAGILCPRANRDRIQISFKTACCRIMTGRAEEGVDTLIAAIDQGVDLWPYAFELLQLLLKEGLYGPIPHLLCPIMKMIRMPLHRLEQLLTELTAFNCYKEAEEVWNIIIGEESRFVQIYQEMIELAKQKLNEGRKEGETEV